MSRAVGASRGTHRDGLRDIAAKWPNAPVASSRTRPVRSSTSERGRRLPHRAEGSRSPRRLHGVPRRPSGDLVVPPERTSARGRPRRIGSRRRQAERAGEASSSTRPASTSGASDRVRPMAGRATTGFPTRFSASQAMTVTCSDARRPASGMRGPIAGAAARFDRTGTPVPKPPTARHRRDEAISAEGSGWGTWIRTKTNGVRVRCSTVKLSPSRRGNEALPAGAGLTSRSNRAAQVPSSSFCRRRRPRPVSTLRTTPDRIAPTAAETVKSRRRAVLSRRRRFVGGQTPVRLVPTCGNVRRARDHR